MPFTATPATGDLAREYLRSMLGRMRCHEPGLAPLFFAFWVAVEAYADPGSLQVNESGRPLGIMCRFTLRGREFFLKYRWGSHNVPRIATGTDEPVLRAETAGSRLDPLRLMQWFEDNAASPVRCPVNHGPRNTSWVGGSSPARPEA